MRKYDDINDLVGKKILRIFASEDHLQFETDEGPFCYHVEGDCCSRSFFYDFYGVKKLFENGPVISTREVPLEVDPTTVKDDQCVVKAYGFEIVTENKEFGEQTSVFSFRNDSNGYYGGVIYLGEPRDVATLKEITDDIAEIL